MGDILRQASTLNRKEVAMTILDQILEHFATACNADPQAFRAFCTLVGLGTLSAKGTKTLPGIKVIGQLSAVQYIKRGELWAHEFHKPLPELGCYDNDLVILRRSSQYGIGHGLQILG